MVFLNRANWVNLVPRAFLLRGEDGRKKTLDRINFHNLQSRHGQAAVRRRKLLYLSKPSTDLLLWNLRDTTSTMFFSTLTGKKSGRSWNSSDLPKPVGRTAITSCQFNICQEPAYFQSTSLEEALNKKKEI